MPEPETEEPDGSKKWTVKVLLQPGETKLLQVLEGDPTKGGRFAYRTKFMLKPGKPPSGQ